MSDSTELVLLLVTTGGRDDAEHLGERLVEERLAACGSVIPAVHSFFHWDGRMQREHEAMLLLKTSPVKAEAAIARIRELHSYDNPEILQLSVTGGSAQYLAWAMNELDAAPD